MSRKPTPYAERVKRRKTPPADGSAPLPGPAPTGVQPSRLHLTLEAIRRLDAFRDRMRVQLRRPALTRSQAAELYLMDLPT